jgi:hypothetical protein
MIKIWMKKGHFGRDYIARLGAGMMVKIHFEFLLN